jgi:hypothetical protein
MSLHQKQEVSHDPQRSSCLGHRARRGGFYFVLFNTNRLGAYDRQRSRDRGFAGRHVDAFAERTGADAGLGHSGGAQRVDAGAGRVPGFSERAGAQRRLRDIAIRRDRVSRYGRPLHERAGAYARLRDIAIRRDRVSRYGRPLHERAGAHARLRDIAIRRDRASR